MRGGKKKHLLTYQNNNDRIQKRKATLLKGTQEFLGLMKIRGHNLEDSKIRESEGSS